MRKLVSWLIEKSSNPITLTKYVHFFGKRWLLSYGKSRYELPERFELYHWVGPVSKTWFHVNKEKGYELFHPSFYPWKLKFQYCSDKANTIVGFRGTTGARKVFSIRQWDKKFIYYLDFEQTYIHWSKKTWLQKLKNGKRRMVEFLTQKTKLPSTN